MGEAEGVGIIYWGLIFYRTLGFIEVVPFPTFPWLPYAQAAPKICLSNDCLLQGQPGAAMRRGCTCWAPVSF